MSDWLSPEQRSHNMASIRSSRNRTTEERLLALLRGARISGWRRHLPLPGKPDFAFRAQRVAIFVDGCFWHGCPRCYRMPEDNRKYWRTKVLGNRMRDRRANKKLRADGWTVLRFWEHRLKTGAGRTRVLSSLRAALAA